MMTTIERLANRAADRPRLAALLLGLLSASGFQPLGLWPLALLGMGGFVLLLSRAKGWKQAMLWGWLFGWAHFTLGNNWIATAFTHQAAMPAVLGWAAVPLLAIYLAVYPALAAAGAFTLVRGRRAALIPAFAGAWIVTEWMRSWVFTGYAWNPFGMVFLGPFDRPGLAALAPIFGTYALSGLAVLVSGGLLFQAMHRRWMASGLAVILLVAGMYWPAGKGEEGALALTVVQPHIVQARINDLAFRQANYSRLSGLSTPAAEDRARLVLWPESGLPDFLEDGYPQRYYDRTTAFGSPAFARARIAQDIGETSLLLTGVTTLEIPQDRVTGAYVTVMAVDGEAQIRGRYDKAHLVPYGEYLPMRWLFEPLGLSRLVPGAVDFLPGPGPDTLHLGQFGNAGVQICYEIVFSGQVVDRADRPDYLFNPSNDGWFGTFGPPQHFAQARMRAIEEGLPVLRSTTTGISGVIDARGVVRAYLPTGAMDRIDTAVPPALPPTLFARMGNTLPLIWAFVILAIATIASRRRAG